MSALIRPLLLAVALTVVLVAGSLALGNAIQTGLAWALIIGAVLAVWAAVIFWRVHRKAPDIQLLERDFWWASEITVAALLIAALAVNFLLGSPLPKGSSFILLAVAILLQEITLALFLVHHYFGRRGG